MHTYDVRRAVHAAVIRADRDALGRNVDAVGLCELRGRTTHLELVLLLFQRTLGIVGVLQACIDRVHERQDQGQPNVVTQRHHGVGEKCVGSVLTKTVQEPGTRAAWRPTL